MVSLDIRLPTCSIHSFLIGDANFDPLAKALASFSTAQLLFSTLQLLCGEIPGDPGSTLLFIRNFHPELASMKDPGPSQPADGHDVGPATCLSHCKFYAVVAAQAVLSVCPFIVWMDSQRLIQSVVVHCHPYLLIKLLDYRMLPCTMCPFCPNFLGKIRMCIIRG